MARSAFNFCDRMIFLVNLQSPLSIMIKFFSPWFSDLDLIGSLGSWSQYLVFCVVESSPSMVEP